MEWIPAHLDLWLNDKSDLSHSTRSIFLRLCLAARMANKNGVVPLPPEAIDTIHGLMIIVQSKLLTSGPNGYAAARAEFELAWAELTHFDMVRGSRYDDWLAVTVTSWAHGWVFHPPVADPPPAEPQAGPIAKTKSTSAERVARYRDRKRSAVSVTGTVTPPVTCNAEGVTEALQRPVTCNAHLGGKGGVSEKENIRKETKEEERISDARANGRNAGGEKCNTKERYIEGVTPPVTSVTPDTENEDPEPTTATLDGRILVALRSSPHIADYERRGMIRLPDCATMLAGLAATAQMNMGLTVSQSEERVIAAIGDVNGKIGDANLTSNPWQPAHVTARLRTFAEGNLRKPRAMWEADRARALNAASGNSATQAAAGNGNGHGGPTPSEQSAELLTLFGQLWSKANKGEPWVQAPSDAATAAKIAGPLAEAASKAGCTFTAMVSHKVGGYLADGDPFLRDKAWPLALFASKVGGYGVPRKKAERAPEPERREFTPEEIEANRVAAAAALKRFSSAGIGLRKAV